LIVLESGEGPQLPIEGQLFKRQQQIDEIDKALVGLSAHPTRTDGGTPQNPDSCNYVSFDAFIEVDCSSITHNGDDSGCNDEPTYN
jgi:hypothetical protein